jgi:hypothetical protein
MSSNDGSKKTSISMPACLGPDTRVVNRRYFRWCHNHGGRLYMHIITGQVLCGFLISPEGFIPSVLTLNLIFHGLKKVLMSKVKMFPLPTISRMSDISIPLPLDMPKKELSFPSIREHMLQMVNDG